MWPHDDDLDDLITPPAYNPECWETRKDWFDWCYEQGYYWIEDSYNPDGTPKGEKLGGLRLGYLKSTE